MKRCLTMLLTLCLLLAAPCSLAQEKIHLTAWFETAFKGIDDPAAEGAEYGDFMRHVADLYMQQNPDVEIEVVVVAGQERSAKLAVAIQSNEIPDLMFDTHFALMDYAHAGLLLPLNDIITEEDLEDIPPAVWNNVTYDDQIFMFPFTSEDGHMAINLDLFEQADCMDYVPQGEIGEWTPEQFLECLRALKKGLPEGVYPFALYAGSATGDTWTNMLLRMFGASFFDEEGKHIVINDEAGVKALEFLLQLQKEKLIAPGAETITSDDAAQLFLNKKVAVSIFNVLFENSLNEGLNNGTIERPFNIKYCYIPNEAEPACFTYVFGSVVWNTGNEKKIQAAKDFVKFYSSMPYASASSAMLPFRASVAENVAGVNPVKAALSDSLRHAVNFNQFVPGYLQLRSAFFPEMQAAYAGDKTAQEALDAFARKGNEILNESVEDSVLLNP